jgi:hypothetical protein
MAIMDTKIAQLRHVFLPHVIAPDGCTFARWSARPDLCDCPQRHKRPEPWPNEPPPLHVKMCRSTQPAA